jgi:hypothetical protein
MSICRSSDWPSDPSWFEELSIRAQARSPNVPGNAWWKAGMAALLATDGDTKELQSAILTGRNPDSIPAGPYKSCTASTLRFQVFQAKFIVLPHNNLKTFSSLRDW